MPSRDQQLGQSRAKVGARARAMETQLERWMLRFALQQGRLMADQVKREGPSSVEGQVSKAKTPTDAQLESQLRRILQTFGLRHVTDAGRRAGGRVGHSEEIVIPRGAVDAYFVTLEPKLQRIMEDTRSEVRRSVGDLIRQSLAERPQPSAGEVARRIRTALHGSPDASGRLVGEIEDEHADVLPTTRLITEPSSGQRGLLYAFSSERAALISRTELNIAENTGIHEGYKVAGVKAKVWIAVTSDRKSGKRMHYKMDDVVVGIDELFVLPDETRMRYPGDPTAPIHQLARCRCTTGAVVIPRR